MRRASRRASAPCAGQASRLARSRRELEALDLVSFRRAIGARIPTLMTAHVVYPALDPRHPATLSRKICHDLLRRRLGFRGVLFSDDLEMHAVSRRPIERVVVEALQAGCDMLLVCASADLARRGIDAVATALGRGRLDPDAVAASLSRIQALRRRRSRSCAIGRDSVAGRRGSSAG